MEPPMAAETAATVAGHFACRRGRKSATILYTADGVVETWAR